MIRVWYSPWISDNYVPNAVDTLRSPGAGEFFVCLCASRCGAEMKLRKDAHHRPGVVMFGSLAWHISWYIYISWYISRYILIYLDISWQQQLVWPQIHQCPFHQMDAAECWHQRGTSHPNLFNNAMNMVMRRLNSLLQLTDDWLGTLGC